MSLRARVSRLERLDERPVGHPVAHLPGSPGRIAFFDPRRPLPEGWVPGPPPRLSVEEWRDMYRSHDAGRGER